MARTTTQVQLCKCYWEGKPRGIITDNKCRKLFQPTGKAETRARYSRTNAALLSLVLAFGAIPSLVDSIQYTMPFDAGQKTAAKQFVAHLESRQATGEDLDDATDLLPLIKFLKALYLGSEMAEKSLFMSVMAIYALKDDGTFKLPNSITPDLAAVNYLAHSLILVSANLELERQNLPKSLKNHQM